MSVPATGSVEALGGDKQLCSPLIGCTDCLAIVLLPVLSVLGLNLCTSTVLTGTEKRQVKSQVFAVYTALTELTFMAKRRAEDTVLHDSPSKRCYRSVCSVDMQLGSMAPSSLGLSPPSLLALLGSRCRKRPYYFEEPEKQQQEEDEEAAAALYRKPTHCDTRKHAAANVSHTSGSFQERRSSNTASKKRAREDCAGSQSDNPQANDRADEDTNTEDCTYNSFQYWRVPLPELDLSLLEDAKERPQTKDKSKVKDSSSVAMET